MSIFKESFRQFVQQQMKIREAVISKGNNGGSRFSGNTVDLSKVGGKKDQAIDSSAFFTNTVQRQCVIRMSSGCDITDFGATEFAEDDKYEKPSHIKGSGLARRYILQGGTLAVDRETLEYSDSSTTTTTPSRVDTTRTRKEKYKYKLGNRSGFRGISPNDFGTAYGDPTIRSNPGEDYGSVPMPGITTANIRTKSAYGSLREAKVEFVCHNQRQLEALELLYMRPGIPILLEWGWTPYINNKGKRTLDFPFIGEWWIAEGSMDSINRQIIQEKVKSGGNYDALAGMCKNFSYKARPDGGFDCVTEIIAQGEIIESLKGESTVIDVSLADFEGKKSKNNSSYDFLEVGLKDFVNFSEAVRYAKSASQYISDVEKLALGNLLAPAAAPHLSYYFGLNDLSKEELVKMEFGDASLSIDKLILNGIKKFILTPDTNFPLNGDSEKSFKINSSYIRWDAFCTFLNLFVINKSAVGVPIVTFSTNTVVDEDLPNPRVEPLLMSRVNVDSIPTVDGQPFSFKVVDVDTNWFDGVYDFSATFGVNAVLNASVNPTICLFPEQLSFSVEGKFSPILYLGAIAIGFGVGSLAGGAIGAGAGAVAGGAIYKKWAGDTKMTSNKKNSRNIGNIYINLKRLQRIYKDQRYDGEGEFNDDFNLHDFIKKVWDDISAASGNKHNFIIHNDLERPSVLRIIDANFQKDDELTLDKIHELNIQSNNTICRDFSYNSVIPSAMSATIGVAMQNPDSIQDIDGATFAAMARGIKSRFHVPAKTEVVAPTADEKKKSIDRYNQIITRATNMFVNLASFQGRLMKGLLQEIDEETGESESQEEISQAQQSLKSFFNHIIKIETLHETNDQYSNGVNYYKGYPKKLQNAPLVSSVIPLKFNAKLDGISGITIGNVFKVEQSRLPKGYRGSDIAFVCMGEQQAITAGQDWTTDIHGQLVLLPPETSTSTSSTSSSSSSSSSSTSSSNPIKKVFTTVNSAGELVGVNDPLAETARLAAQMNAIDMEVTEGSEEKLRIQEYGFDPKPFAERIYKTMEGPSGPFQTAAPLFKIYEELNERKRKIVNKYFDDFGVDGSGSYTLYEWIEGDFNGTFDSEADWIKLQELIKY